MQTRIYLIRHGESLANYEGIFIGQTDMDLTERGYEQASLLPNFFENIRLDSLYSSDLIRAMHTIEPLSKAKNLPINKDRNLREIFAGDFEGMLFKEIPDKYPKMWLDWAIPKTNAPTPNGETLLDVQSRAYDGIEKIALENEGKTVAIATHAVVIRTFINRVLKKGFDELYKLDFVGNASVSCFVYENGEFKIEFLNDFSHLGNLKTFIPNKI